MKEELIAKGCGCFLVLLICGFCFGAIFIIVTKPAEIWHGVSGYLNNNYEFQEYSSEKTSNEVEQDIVGQVKNVGENEIFVSEGDLNVLLKNRISQFKDLSVDLEDGEARVFWKLDSTETPVLGEAVLVLDDQNRLQITQLGTPRHAFPKFLYPAINNLAAQFLNQDFVKDQITLLNNDNNLKIEEVKILKDKVYFKVFVDLKIF